MTRTDPSPRRHPLTAILLRRRPSPASVLSRHRRPLAAVAAGCLTAGLATLAGPAAPAIAGTSPGPAVTGVNCQPEQFPDANAPRSAPPVPYEIPFTATLGPDPSPSGVYSNPPVYPVVPEGGYLEIIGTSRLIPGAHVTVTLGGPVVAGKGQIYARSCGRVILPSQTGGIGANQYIPTGQGGEYNPNFQFSTEIPVSIGITLPGITMPTLLSLPTPIVASGSSDGFLGADIQPTPAANGGLNVDFYATDKSTTNLSAVLGLFGTSVGGSDCTVTIGDLATAGLPVPAGGIDGLTHQQATTSVHLTSKTSGSYTGQPVTGPIAPNAAGHAQDHAVLVSNDFPIAAIDPNMPPSPNFVGGQPTCSASNAGLLNNLIGLPTAAGQNVFVAPSTFGVYTSS